MDKQQIHDLAVQIADEIFTYYSPGPIKARRIVMEFEKTLDGPGLNYSAIVWRIEEILSLKCGG